MTRTVKAPDERRSELIAAAQKLFFTRGYKSTSVTDIVNEVGVAKGLFYYYFNTKQAVLEALVDEMIAQSVAVMHQIVVDDGLDALQKWERAMGTVGNWKLDRKAELLALARMLYSDENVLLRRKMEELTMRHVVPEFTQIVAQGVEEGVFSTPYVAESAEIIFAIALAGRDAIYEIVLYPGRFDDPVELLSRKMEAMVAAIERVLGAAPGSLSWGDPALVAQWIAYSSSVEDEHQLEKS